MDTRKEFDSKKQYFYSKMAKECGNCGNTHNLEVHHIVPIALGGTNRLTNMVALCTECHGKIHGKDRTLNSELRKRGMEKAKLAGVKFGRPRAIDNMQEFAEVYNNWKAGNISQTEAYKQLNISKSTFIRMCKRIATTQTPNKESFLMQ